MNKEINFSFGVEFPEDDVLFMPEEEIDRYISGQKPQNSKMKDVSDMNTFIRFCCTILERVV